MKSIARFAAAVLVGSVGMSVAGAVLAGKPRKAVMTKTEVTYQPATYADLPNWADDDHLAALGAFLKSCDKVLDAVRGGGMSGKAKAEPAMMAACEDAKALASSKVDRAAARAYFESHFTPHRVVHAGGQGLLTGYYEPLIKGSREPRPGFTSPVLRRPSDLVNLVDETQRGASGNALTHARQTATGIVPYPTRAEIDQGALSGKGLEILYLSDPVELFFLQVQGSGRVQLPDGKSLRITYDGKNGHPYTSVGRYMIDQGHIEESKASLETMRTWLKADLARAKPILWQNASYVFFREMAPDEADGPLGALKIPLTDGRSLAVDAGIHTLGSPVYVSSGALKHATSTGGFHRLMIAQDVGSAIKGPERGDIYFGSGDAAGKLAGITKHPGNFFVLVPRLAGVPLQEAGKAPATQVRQAQQ